MQIYKKYSVVAVPFPFTDKDYTKKRPALIISLEEYQQNTHHCVLAMITSAKQSQWKTDITIRDLEAAGLPGLSIIRQKIFTLDERLILQTLGELSEKDRISVKHMLDRTFLDLAA